MAAKLFSLDCQDVVWRFVGAAHLASGLLL
jgi:hypothetical protein